MCDDAETWRDCSILDDPDEHTRILEMLLFCLGLKVQIESDTDALRLVPAEAKAVEGEK